MPGIAELDQIHGITTTQETATATGGIDLLKLMRTVDEWASSLRLYVTMTVQRALLMKGGMFGAFRQLFQGMGTGIGVVSENKHGSWQASGKTQLFEEE